MKKLVSFLAVLCAVMLSLAFVSCSHDADSGSSSGSGSSSYAFQGKEYIGEVDGGTVAVDFYPTGNNALVTQIDPEYGQMSFGCSYTVSGNTVIISFNGNSIALTYYPNEDSFLWGSNLLRRNG